MESTPITLMVKYSNGQLKKFFYASAVMANEMAQSMRLDAEVIFATVIG